MGRWVVDRRPFSPLAACDPAATPLPPPPVVSDQGEVVDGLPRADFIAKKVTPRMARIQELDAEIKATISDSQKRDRLVREMAATRRLLAREQAKLGIAQNRLNEGLLTEGLRWRKQESWFGERVNPDFAQQRGSEQPCRRRPSRKENWVTPLPPRSGRFSFTVFLSGYLK